MLIVNATKPQLRFDDVTSLSGIPSKNYLLWLLCAHIRRLNPKRSLDAGCGELRNYWMFSGEYVGISMQRSNYINGMKRLRSLIEERGVPQIYLMRFESDFSFLGAFDLCVCTNSFGGSPSEADVARRLAERVKKGGSLIVTTAMDATTSLAEVLEPYFAQVEIVYYGYKHCNDRCFNKEAISELTHEEMRAPNTPVGHAGVFIHAYDKLIAPAADSPPPSIRNDEGLNIVENDIPYLEMN